MYDNSSVLQQLHKTITLLVQCLHLFSKIITGVTCENLISFKSYMQISKIMYSM